MTLLIHPGFHKTGTTWMQEVLFKDERLFNLMFDQLETDALLVRPHDFQFSKQDATASIDARRSAADSNLIDVISSELLCGNMFSGSRDSRILAERLFAVTGPAKILLTVRAQRPMLKSVYLQYVKRGGRKSLTDFLNFEPEPGYNWFRPEIFEFHHLADHYASLFGAQNILVLPQELLIGDRQAFFEILMKFVTGEALVEGMSVSNEKGVGISPPSSAIPMLRFANLLRKTPVNPEAMTSFSGVGDLLTSLSYRMRFGRKRKDANISREIKSFADGRYGVSNTKLQSYVPVDLSDLGYETQS
ncbi:hypothetical protein MNBD_ALPHA04-675 [hydrothermal vent metagenome]|uniref:Sulfotransferase domain-containing protein n=1 Tax=hydrothermal vent metagenome TaxID=652676 RepID=A0A3B0S7W1_9ZZZZ